MPRRTSSDHNPNQKKMHNNFGPKPGRTRWVPPPLALKTWGLYPFNPLGSAAEPCSHLSFFSPSASPSLQDLSIDTVVVPIKNSLLTPPNHQEMKVQTCTDIGHGIHTLKNGHWKNETQRKEDVGEGSLGTDALLTWICQFCELRCFLEQSWWGQSSFLDYAAASCSHAITALTGTMPFLSRPFLYLSRSRLWLSHTMS